MSQDLNSVTQITSDHVEVVTLVRPSGTAVSQAVEEARGQSVYGTGASYGDDHMEIVDAAIELRVPQVNLGLTPLIGTSDESEYIEVDGTTYAPVTVPHSAIAAGKKVKAFMLTGYVPQENGYATHSYGLVNSELQTLHHMELIKLMQEKLLTATGSPLSVRDIIFDRTFQRMVVAFRLPETDVVGDIIQNDLLVWSDMNRSGKAGMMLGQLPIRCTNTINVLQSQANGQWTIKGRRGNIEDIVSHGSQFAQTAMDEMREFYTLMNEVPVSEQTVNIVLGDLYPVPQTPRRKFQESRTDHNKRRMGWIQKRAEILAEQETVKHIFENKTGTAAQLENPYSAYGLFQAISEKATYANPGNAESHMLAMLGGGKLQKEVRTGFELCMGIVQSKELDARAVKRGIDTRWDK